MQECSPASFQDLPHPNQQLLVGEPRLMGVGVLEQRVCACPARTGRPAVCGEAEGLDVGDVRRGLLVLAAGEHGHVRGHSLGGLLTELIP